MNKTLQYTLGIVFIIIGVIGLFLPFLQGILLIGLGILILNADDFAHAKRMISETIKKPKRKN